MIRKREMPYLNDEHKHQPQRGCGVSNWHVACVGFLNAYYTAKFGGIIAGFREIDDQETTRMVLV